MIRKFATVPGFRVVLALILATTLAGATSLHAQQAPAPAPASQTPAPPTDQQQPVPPKPDSQQPGTQQTPLEEIGLGRKPKVKNWTNWSFNVGTGANLPSGTTDKFVRGGGGVVAAGVARNYSEYFGFRLDFQWDNLPLRDSALVLAQAPGATSHVYSLHLDPIINLPFSKTWGGYVLAGPSYFYRSGKLDSSTAIPGTACNSFYGWWGSCFAGSLPLSGDFLKTHQNDHGENFGAGITYTIRPHVDIYAEVRYFHGKSGLNTTDLRPITVGVRW